LSSSENLSKALRDCHSKQAWERFFAAHQDEFVKNPKTLKDVVRAFAADPQSGNYPPTFWGLLLNAALSLWNFELGVELAEITKKIPSLEVIVPAAKVYLESGSPSKTRATAQRGLRLKEVTHYDQIQLKLLIINSYAEEGKRQKAVKLLEQLQGELNGALQVPQRADLSMRIGRMQFFLGRYEDAGRLFYEAAKFYRECADWENAAKALFNTAASYENSGTVDKTLTLSFVEECRRLAESQHLEGYISHCEALYGVEACNRGHFAAAKEHFRRALRHLPPTDKTFRRLHIVSLLAITYFRMGRFHLARKFGEQTLSLAKLDESDRYRSRYVMLEAELLWENEQFEESQELLRAAISPIEAKGIQNLEEMGIFSRFHLQAAILGETEISDKYAVPEQIGHHDHSTLERLCTLAELYLNRNRNEDATATWSTALNKARAHGFLYHEALSLLGLAQAKLHTWNSQDSDNVIRELAVAIAKIGDTPLKATFRVVLAGQAYQAGDFAECCRQLREAASIGAVGAAEKLGIQASLATIDGHSPKLTSPTHLAIVARFVRTYFAPSISQIDSKNYLVSKHYHVSLERHPALAELLHYLLAKGDFSAQGSDIQTQVWHQSLQAVGWQQKIRNSIMRLRELFPYTVGPLLLHGHDIRLFHEAIAVQRFREGELAIDAEILRLVVETPLSSQQVSERLGISVSTIKRTLKRLTEANQVSVLRSGRNIVYFARRN
jgi:tetratricopeptide (TPR) repeat protein/predicted DNA-binding protein (UPF0251 family)